MVGFFFNSSKNKEHSGYWFDILYLISSWHLHRSVVLDKWIWCSMLSSSPPWSLWSAGRGLLFWSIQEYTKTGPFYIKLHIHRLDNNPCKQVVLEYLVRSINYRRFLRQFFGQPWWHWPALPCLIDDFFIFVIILNNYDPTFHISSSLVYFESRSVLFNLARSVLNLFLFYFRYYN